MNLAFHYHIPYQKINEIYYTDGQQGVFIEALSPFFNKIICFLHEPLEHEKSSMDYAFKSENIEIVSLGPHLSLPQRLLRINKYLSIFKSHKSEFDILLIRTPTPLSNFLISQFRDKSSIYVVGDYVDGLSTMKGSKLKRLLISFWAYSYEYFQNENARNICTITNSQLKYQKLIKYNNMTKLIKSTTLKSSDFFVREDTCQSDKIRILYTGRIDEAKGLEDILNAIFGLIDRGFKLELHIAGFFLGKNNGLIDLLIAEALKRGLQDLIIWHGKLKIGNELNSLYRMCDIYCLASRSGFEGFPRTLWEAMANSLPIVATKVGSIPFFLKNDVSACLINPNNYNDIMDALEKIVRSEELRKRLILNGRLLAKDNTLENTSFKMASELKNYINKEIESQ